MAFKPEVNQRLNIGDTVYYVAEHPAAPDVAYGQEGRAATVYKLTGQDKKPQALKAFKPRYRLPALAGQAAKIAPLANLPGLAVCHRTVLSATRYRALLRQHPDLTYAVLMPWVHGPTWTEVLAENQELTPDRSLSLAQKLAEILARMEEQGLAHCDLSGSNVLLPCLAEVDTPDAHSAVELVDVEQLYSSDLKRPEVLTVGSDGYAHRSAPRDLWGSTADRFSGAVLLGEILSWSDKRIREQAYGESYFSKDEIQQESDRYRILLTVLRERWGVGVARLFERAWHSDLLASCPTFGEWLVALPEQVPVADTSGATVKSEDVQEGRPASTEGALKMLINLGQRLEAQDNLEGALEVYRQAQAMAVAGSDLSEELAFLVKRLEEKRGKTIRAESESKLVGEVDPTSAGSRSATDEELDEPTSDAAQAALERELALIDREEQEASVEETDTELEQLFNDGLAAYEREEWAKAKELLAEVIRREPEYALGGQSARKLLREIEGYLNPSQSTWIERLTSSRWARVAGGVMALIAMIGLLAVLVFRPGTIVPLSTSHDLFVSDRSGKREIYRLTEEGAVVQVTSTPGDGESWAPAVSPSGAVLFTSDRSGKREIYRLGGEGTAQQVTNTPGSAESWAPVASASGAVLFTSNRGGRREIYRLTLEGATEYVTNTPGDGESWSPVISPSGTILFTSDRSGKSEIYRLTREGTVVQVTSTPGDGESWEPVVNRIGAVLFTSNRGGKREVYRLGGQGVVDQLTHTSGTDESWAPGLSSSGSILFTSNRGGRREVYRLAEGTAVQVTNAPGFYESWLGASE